MNARRSRPTPFCLIVVAAIVGCGGSDEPSRSQPQMTVGETAQPIATAPQTQESKMPAFASEAASANTGKNQAQEDAAITKTVRNALLADPEFKRTNLGVDTRVGVVTLRGTVGAQEYIDRAVIIARRAEGVADVRSYVIVSIHVPTRTR